MDGGKVIAKQPRHGLVQCRVSTIPQAIEIPAALSVLATNDPDGDGDNNDYYEIQIGPQDLVFDSRFDKYNQPRLLPNGPFGHEEWSAQAKHAVALRGTLNDSSDKDLGYTLEAEIPWVVFDKAKTVPPKFGDTWRMNFYAMRSNGGVAWSPILGEGNFHKASRFGRVLWSH